MNKNKNFSKTCLFGQGVFPRKTIGRIMKRPSPPSHELLRVAETILFSRRKFDGFKKCYHNLEQRIMGEMGKEKCFVVPQDCIQFVWGVETPCNGLHASLLYFNYLSSPKLQWKPPEMQWQILHQSEGAQSNFKSFYCISMLLLCRAPIEVRDLQNICIHNSSLSPIILCLSLQ